MERIGTLDSRGETGEYKDTPAYAARGRAFEPDKGERSRERLEISLPELRRSVDRRRCSSASVLIRRHRSASAVRTPRNA